MFNLQSGHHRQRFPPALTLAQAQALKAKNAKPALSTRLTESNGYSRGEGKHKRDVTGLAVDATNSTVISCGLDGKIKVSRNLHVWITS